MLEKRRSGRAPTKTSIEDEIAHLRGLDLKGLRARWQSVFQSPPPDHLPRHLLFAIIAYRIQADLLGDLDQETRQVLDWTDAKNTGVTMSSRLVSFDQKRTELTPGAKLAAPRQAGKPAFYAMASAPALKAIRSLAGPGKLPSFVNVNGRETPALLTLF